MECRRYLIAGLFVSLSLAAGQAVAQSRAEYGRYLADAADCAACHTVPGGTPYAGGRPIETPFGVIYSRNLTPDVDTGLGAWSHDDFYRAMHEGVSKDGDHLYPAFPFTYFTRLSREDTDAIKDYLATLPAVKNATPSNEFPWPISQRWTMWWWKLMFFRPDTDPLPSPMRSPGDASRGAYLVEALGHCGACHTPKNILGADKRSVPLQGGTIENWVSPNLTGDPRSGLGEWTERDIVEYLKTGRNARALASGPMAEVVEVSTSKLNDVDLQAIAAYLKKIPAGGRDATSVQVDQDIFKTGETIFVDACTACHQVSGEALPRAFAPLKNSASVQAENPLSVIRVILKGSRAATTDAQPTPFTMPAFDWKLDDDEVAAVATYVRNAWGNMAPSVSVSDVRKLRRELERAASIND